MSSIHKGLRASLQLLPRQIKHHARHLLFLACTVVGFSTLVCAILMMLVVAIENDQPDHEKRQGYLGGRVAMAILQRVGQMENEDLAVIGGLKGVDIALKCEDTQSCEQAKQWIALSGATLVPHADLTLHKTNGQWAIVSSNHKGNAFVASNVLTNIANRDHISNGQLGNMAGATMTGNIDGKYRETTDMIQGVLFLTVMLGIVFPLFKGMFIITGAIARDLALDRDRGDLEAFMLTPQPIWVIPFVRALAGGINMMGLTLLTLCLAQLWVGSIHFIVVLSLATAIGCVTTAVAMVGSVQALMFRSFLMRIIVGYILNPITFIFLGLTILIIQKLPDLFSFALISQRVPLVEWPPLLGVGISGMLIALSMCVVGVSATAFHLIYNQRRQNFSAN